MHEIMFEKMLDKIHGCWYGKCLGGAAGAPVEGIKGIIETDDFEEIFNPDLPNDDLDIQLLWLEVLEQKGVSINSTDLAEAWIEKCWYPFSEYGYFMKNYERGINPPYSGIINNSFFKEGMGCPIRSEIWGLISAGNSRLAADYAYIDATLDHADNSVYAEQFLAAAESLAFFETDMLKLINKAMKYIPEDSKLNKCFREVIDCFNSGTHWLEARKTILNKYSHPDFTNVVQNLGFTLIALLYGKNDMRRTINIALKCGYDTDCTCASAGALLGIMLGYSGMGEKITSLIKDYFICGIDVKRPSNSIKGLAEDTIRLALSVDNENLLITNIPKQFENIEKKKPVIDIIKPSADGLNTELLKTEPVKWHAYGPYFEQLRKPIDERYPSPHAEGCVLPDIVCMVNNEVHLDKEYIDETKLIMPDADYIATIEAYEDLIPLKNEIGMEGQMCVYLRTCVVSTVAQRIWLIAGNTDGFAIWVNKQKVLEADEIRGYTPYNNFCLADLKAGENEIILKLLRRTDSMKFALGLRRYNGQHWHRSKWCTDLIYK